MKEKILVFDFDGTIADTSEAAFAIFNSLSKEFKLRKVASHEVERLKDMTSQDINRYLKIPAIKAPFIIRKALKRLHSDMTSIDVIHGLREILIQIKSLNIKMGILTSNSTENVMKFLKIHELELFDFVAGSSKIWGKCKGLKGIARKHGIEPIALLYIGDETRDIEAAKKAGVRIAAVTWGYNSQKILREHAPDYLATKPGELLQIVEGFCDLDTSEK